MLKVKMLVFCADLNSKPISIFGTTTRETSSQKKRGKAKHLYHSYQTVMSSCQSCSIHLQVTYSLFERICSSPKSTHYVFTWKPNDPKLLISFLCHRTNHDDAFFPDDSIHTISSPPHLFVLLYCKLSCMYGKRAYSYISGRNLARISHCQVTDPVILSCWAIAVMMIQGQSSCRPLGNYITSSFQSYQEQIFWVILILKSHLFTVFTPPPRLPVQGYV